MTYEQGNKVMWRLPDGGPTQLELRIKKKIWEQDTQDRAHTFPNSTPH